MPDAASYLDNKIFKSFWNDNIAEVPDLWSFIIVMLGFCTCLLFSRTEANVISRQWIHGLKLSSWYNSDECFQKHSKQASNKNIFIFLWQMLF